MNLMAASHDDVSAASATHVLRGEGRLMVSISIVWLYRYRPNVVIVVGCHAVAGPHDDDDDDGYLLLGKECDSLPSPTSEQYHWKYPATGHWMGRAATLQLHVD